MSRSEARISVTIWAPESDFTSLSSGAQWMYFFLLSQRDLAHTGVLALRERRWSRAAADLTIDTINGRLAELETARYIVIDHDTEELIIRTYIRGDKVYRQPKVLRNAADQLPLIVSPILRAVLAAELRRVSQLEMSEASREIVAEMIAALPSPDETPGEKGIPNGTANPISDQQSIDGNPTRCPPGDRGIVTAVRRAAPSPYPQAPIPEPPRAGAPADTRPHGHAREEPPPGSPPPGVAERIVTEWASTLRKPPQRKITNHIGLIVQAALTDGQDPDDIREALRRWQAKGNLGPAVLPALIHEVANTPGPGTDPAPARASPRPSTTDARVAAGLALAAKYDAMEEDQ